MNPTITYNKKDIRQLIKNYYATYKQILNANVFIGTKVGTVGQGMMEHEDAIITVSVSYETDIAGINKKINDNLSLEETANIIATILKDSGYKVNSSYSNAGTFSDYVGYGIDEHLVKRPYFNGITFNITENEEESLSRKYKN